MATKIRIRRDTLENFMTNNIILAGGELAATYEYLGNTDSEGVMVYENYTFYIGDGVNLIADLQPLITKQIADAQFAPLDLFNAVKSNLEYLEGNVVRYTTVQELIAEVTGGSSATILALSARIDALENGGMSLAEVDGGGAVA